METEAAPADEAAAPAAGDDAAAPRPKVKFFAKGNRLVIRIPRAVLGIGEKVDFEFKWNDNMQKEGDIMDFYVSGDTAPGGRFNYVYDTKGH